MKFYKTRTNLIILLLIIILVGIFYTIYNNYKSELQVKKEEFTEFNVSNEKTRLAEKILQFIDEDRKYTDYADLLIQLKNKSYNIVKPETFYELKSLKKLNKLSVNDIVKYMNDI